MRKKKLNLKTIESKLSRDEMRKIMAGSEPCADIGQGCGINNLPACCQPPRVPFGLVCNGVYVCEPLPL